MLQMLPEQVLAALLRRRSATRSPATRDQGASLVGVPWWLLWVLCHSRTSSLPMETSVPNDDETLRAQRDERHHAFLHIISCCGCGAVRSERVARGAVCAG